MTLESYKELALYDTTYIHNLKENNKSKLRTTIKNYNRLEEIELKNILIVMEQQRKEQMKINDLNTKEENRIKESKDFYKLKQIAIEPFIKQTDIDRIKTNSKIGGSDGSQYLEIKLEGNDTIFAAAESLIYKDNGVSQAELALDDIFQSMRKMLAGENLFYQKFSAVPGKKEGIVVLGTNFINSIICIKVEKNKPIRFSRGSFLASTPNIKLDMTIQIKGIFGIGQEEGFILPIAECVFGLYGYVWLSAYGSFKEIDMSEQNYEITIDNGMFLACENSKQYEIVFMGKGLLSSFFGGEGFGMKFTSGVPLYIQTKNSNELITTDEGAGGEEDGIINNLTNMDMGINDMSIDDNLVLLDDY